MKPPHTPRSPGDLPRRVPGSARPVGSGTARAGDGEQAPPEEPGRASGAGGAGAALPRLAQISSLGSRGNTGRDVEAPTSGAAPDTPARVFVRTGGRPRSEGFRGALGVVSIVGLLAVGGVLVTLGLIGGHDEGRERTTATMDSGGYGADVAAGFGGVPVPSASASGTAVGKRPDGSAGPTSASPTSSASPGDSPAGRRTTAPAKGGAGVGQTAPAAVPGVSVFSHASQCCIDVVGGKAVAGAGLMIWDCSGSASQHWTFTGGAIRALGMCVQLVDGSTADGTDLELAACDGGAAQRSLLNSSHDLVHTPTGKCTDVRDNQTANGSRLQLWSCSGGDNQKWSTS
ncbi:RICIN domain-containing protein [Streptomyces sp. NPDC005483]|uniref:RICIN domain-containing protein n=1 Tax=Streptomyces sp. NPDC005483 TaxID=3154882 RepID=UPI00339E4B90